MRKDINEIEAGIGPSYETLNYSNLNDSRFRRRQVMSAASVHRQKVPAGSRPDDRGGVRSPDDQHRGQADQAPDLGHGKLKQTCRPTHL